jgi:hypothetical protein
MKKEFIMINGTIQDYDDYAKNIILLKSYLRSKFSEVVLEECFEIKKLENRAYHSARWVFVNKSKDLELVVSLRKRSEEVFV